MLLCDTIFFEAYHLTGSLRREQKKTFAFGYTRGGILNGGRRGRGKNQIMKNDAKSKSLYASPVSINPTIFNKIRWVAGSLGQSSH